MDTANLRSIIDDSLNEAISYEAYTALVDQLVAEEKTTGPKQHEDLVYYTKLNAQRSRRLNKTATVSEPIATVVKSLEGSYTWLVLTESWCGDAAQILPLFQKLAEINPNISLKLVLRDENDALMSQFLTNGGRSIPKLIMLNEQKEVVGTWGPRPKALQEIYDAWRNDPNKPPYKEFQVDMQKWYLKDAGNSTFREIGEILSSLEVAEVAS